MPFLTLFGEADPTETTAHQRSQSVDVSYVHQFGEMLPRRGGGGPLLRSQDADLEGKLSPVPD